VPVFVYEKGKRHGWLGTARGAGRVIDGYGVSGVLCVYLFLISHDCVFYVDRVIWWLGDRGEAVCGWRNNVIQHSGG
jgi:hypothetical protein